ncbi:class I SAM-dependent methyltransferase [Winogradskyella alexanderae]|uniref:Class I SAM-dependent methyltransferase n=1 Tax=Winogradskyella alexanderae TaxID=2877123 RepID=A0ABS7XSX9_9FLAO|nr:class I SAM-dependent methyltransferase [Winogradskyella alexanderae]MCA0133120.1 class I SAM-dependent methyltransferase [Winogradskyella alexanderae]
MISILKRNKRLNKLISILSPKSLETRLQIRAAEDTCAYIEAHMLNVHSKTSRNTVIKMALENVSIDGQYLEFGVFSGQTINLIANEKPNENIYGFDSFEGLPEAWRDGYLPGHFHKKNKLPKVSKNVTLIKGWFSDTLPKFAQEHKMPIAFLHVDCDLYSSTKTIFENLQPLITKGTVIVFDEYFNYPGWRDGEYKAFMEFVKEYNVNFKYLTYNRFNEQVAIEITSI